MFSLAVDCKSFTSFQELIPLLGLGEMHTVPMDNAVWLEKAGKPLQNLQLYKELAWCNLLHCKGSHLTRISNISYFEF